MAKVQDVATLEGRRAELERELAANRAALAEAQEREQRAAERAAAAAHRQRQAEAEPRVAEQERVLAELQAHVEAAVPLIRRALDLGAQIHPAVQALGWYAPEAYSRGVELRMAHYLAWRLAEAGLEGHFSRPAVSLRQPLV